jgi:hypothetical protein
MPAVGLELKFMRDIGWACARRGAAHLRSTTRPGQARVRIEGALGTIAFAACWVILHRPGALPMSPTPPPFKPQPQPAPGKSEAMDPRPDDGEDTYRGSNGMTLSSPMPGRRV